MNYAWEILLQADREEISRDSLRFTNAAHPSPYIELSMENLNADSIEEQTIEINPLYRFAREFGLLFDINLPGLEQTREVFFDTCLHYISQLDLREGLSRQDYYLDLLMEDILHRKIGKKYQRIFLLFNDRERKVWTTALLSLLKEGEYLYEFRKVIKHLYPHSILYVNNDFAYEYLLYLGVRETETERERIALLIRLFMPLQATVHLFYDHHFGIIGIDETMLIDEMMIF